MSATPEQISIDEKALEAAQAALHECWDTNPEAPGQLYGREAEMLSRAAITAYLSATKDAQAERLRVLEGALKQINQTLCVPAAEYVPAIRDCFDIIDAARAALRGEA